MNSELENRFKFHPAETQEAKDHHARIRKVMRDATAEIVAVIPESHEASLFTTHMDQAMMFANAAVARHSSTVIQPSTAKK